MMVINTKPFVTSLQEFRVPLDVTVVNTTSSLGLSTPSVLQNHEVLQISPTSGMNTTATKYGCLTQLENLFMTQAPCPPQDPHLERLHARHDDIFSLHPSDQVNLAEALVENDDRGVDPSHKELNASNNAELKNIHLVEVRSTSNNSDIISLCNFHLGIHPGIKMTKKSH